MHVEILRNDHDPDHVAVVKVRDEPQGEPIQAWFVESDPGFGFLARELRTGNVTANCDTVAEVVGYIAQDVAEEMGIGGESSD